VFGLFFQSFSRLLKTTRTVGAWSSKGILPSFFLDNAWIPQLLKTLEDYFMMLPIRRKPNVPPFFRHLVFTYVLAPQTEKKTPKKPLVT
jgi:hypothetical protein